MSAHCWQVWAVWLLFVQSVIAQFNTTIRFTLTSLDGPVDVDAARSWHAGLPFTVDTETGYRTSTGRSSGVFGSSFVGTGFEVQGYGLWKYGQPTEDDSENTSTLHPVYAWLSHSDQDWQKEELLELTGNVTNDPRLFTATNFSLSTYDLIWTFRADSQLEFHNLTIDIPIRTQAPSLADLQSQATFVPTVRRDGRLQSTMRLGASSKVRRQLRDMFRAREDVMPPRFSANDNGVIRYRKRDGNYKLGGDYVMLKNMTELSYTAPPNTTLIQVFGPVGQMNGSVGGSMCYADLDPPPPWWKNASFPLSSSEKAVNGVNRTLFLLPINPSVQTTVRVGTLGLDSTCFISGISSYPFHYNYTLANLATVNSSSNKDHTEASSADQSSANAKSKHRIGVIVGVVVGVGGALMLAALLFWYLHRQRKQQAKAAPNAEPYEISEKDLYRTASWAPHNAQVGPGESQVHSRSAPANNTRPRPRRVVQEQDAAERLEHLPTYEGQHPPHNAEGSPPIPSSSGGSTGPFANEAREQPQQRSALKIDTIRALEPGPDSADRYTTHVTTSQLKEEYARVFGVPRSSEKLSSCSSEEETPPLKEEYARAFDSI